MEIKNKLVVRTILFFGFSVLNLVAIYYSSESQLKSLIFSQVSLLLAKSLIFPLDNEVDRFRANFSKASILFGLIVFFLVSILLQQVIPNFEIALVLCYLLVIILKYDAKILPAEIISTTIPLYLVFGHIYVMLACILVFSYSAKSILSVVSFPSVTAYLRSLRLSSQYIPRSFSAVMSGYVDEIIIAAFLSNYLFETKVIKSIAGVVGKIQYVFNINQYESMHKTPSKWDSESFKKNIGNWHVFVLLVFSCAILAVFAIGMFWLGSPLPTELYIIVCITFAKFYGGWSGAIFNVKQSNEIIGKYYLTLAAAYAFVFLIVAKLNLMISLAYLLCLQIAFNHYVYSRVK